MALSGEGRKGIEKRQSEEKTLALFAEAEARLSLGAPLKLRASRRARRMSVRIDAPAHTVELVLPFGVAASKGLLFLSDKREWIKRRLAALPERVPFVEGALVPIRGVPHRIVRETDAKAPLVAIEGGEIRVRGDPAHLSRRLKDHLVALARREFAGRAPLEALAIGRRPRKVGVRDTKSRWGSCSQKGTLSFSWRLILAPEGVIDYLLAHEVAHLAEMNHGPRFWRLVERLLDKGAAPPAARAIGQARLWLARHKNELLCYG